MAGSVVFPVEEYSHTLPLAVRIPHDFETEGHLLDSYQLHLDAIDDLVSMLITPFIWSSSFVSHRVDPPGGSGILRNAFRSATALGCAMTIAMRIRVFRCRYP